MATKKVVRRFSRYGVIVLSICFFLFFLKLNYPFTGKFTINGKSYPLANATIAILTIIPFSVLFGWLVYIYLKSMVKRIVEKTIRRLHKQTFGKKIIEVNDEWFSVESPISLVKYRWAVVDPIIETQEFIFVASRKQLITSIPIRAFKRSKEKIALVEFCNKSIRLNKNKNN